MCDIPKGILKDCVRYSLGKPVKKEIIHYVKYMMKNMIGNGTLRERIVTEILKYEHFEHLHGYDAYCNERNKPVEIKSEAYSPIRQSMGKLAGNAAYGFATVSKLKSINKDNPIVVNAGFTDKGHLVYIASYDWKDSSNYKRMMATKQYGSKNTALKTNYKNWPDTRKLDINFFNEKFKHTLNKNILKTIELANSK